MQLSFTDDSLPVHNLDSDKMMAWRKMMAFLIEATVPMNDEGTSAKRG